MLETWEEPDDMWGVDVGRVGRGRPKKAEPDDIITKAVPMAKVVDEEAKAELAKIKKEHSILQKKYDAQTDILKQLAPTINQLDELFRDAAQHMEADTLDDVYSIGQIGAEFKKLRANIDKYIPKEYVIDPTPYLDAAVARYKAGR